MLKKTLAFALIALLLVAGCGKNAPTQGGPQATPETGGGQQTTPGGGTNPATTPSGGGNQQPATSGQQQPTQPTYQKVSLGPLKVGEVAKVGPLEVKLAETAVVGQTTGLPPGYMYLLIRMNIKNTGTDEYTVNVSDHYKLTSPDGKVRTMNVQAASQRNPRLQGTLHQGETTDGWLGYLVKAGAGTNKFQFIHPDWGDATWEFATN